MRSIEQPVFADGKADALRTAPIASVRQRSNCAKSLGWMRIFERILRKFERPRLIEKNCLASRRRQSLLSLTQKAEKFFHPLEARSTAQVSLIIGKNYRPRSGKISWAPCRPSSRSWLLAARKEKADGHRARASYVLRSHRGRNGWVVYRHGILYSQNTDTTSDSRLWSRRLWRIVREFNPAREHCWMAESDGQIVGSVFLVEKSKTVSKLRLLLVETFGASMGLASDWWPSAYAFARRPATRP